MEMTSLGIHKFLLTKSVSIKEISRDHKVTSNITGGFGLHKLYFSISSCSRKQEYVIRIV